VAVLSTSSAAAADAGVGLKLFDVMSYGATGKGKQLDHPAINLAIDACNRAGGGVVCLPPGVYLSGTVELKSNVTLYLEAGATLLGSDKISDYARHPFERESYSVKVGYLREQHLIYARGAENIGIAGPGRIDGHGLAFIEPSGHQPPAPEDLWHGTTLAGWKPRPRPVPMILVVECNHVRIESVRLENSPGRAFQPINCDNVFVRGIFVKAKLYAPNADGIDPIGCQNVLISDCYVETGDDSMCFKSENPYGDTVRVARNITITNCVLRTNCNGVKFGTMTWGGYENVTISNCVISAAAEPLNERPISGFAIEMVDGGWLEGLLISNVRMQNVRTPIFIRRGNRSPRPDGSLGTLRGVMIDNLHASGATLTSSITGLPGFNVEDVTLSNIRIDSAEGGQAEWAEQTIPERPAIYPEAWMYGRLPSYGLYCRHVAGLRVRNLEFGAVAAEARPAIVCDDVESLDIDGLRAAPAVSGQPVIKLIQTRSALLRGCRAPAGTKTFLEIHGNQTERIVLAASDLGTAEKAVQAGSDVPPGAVSMDSIRPLEF
jgi:hypothetical protein